MQALKVQNANYTYVIKLNNIKMFLMLTILFNQF